MRHHKAIGVALSLIVALATVLAACSSSKNAAKIHAAWRKVST